MLCMYDTVEEAIEAANAILPGIAAPDGESDPRWQAFLEIWHFVQDEPEPIWKYGHAQVPVNSKRIDDLRRRLGIPVNGDPLPQD